MAWRESHHVEPMIHQNPIPTATRTGNMLFTSVIGGRDLETGKTPESAEEQAHNCFKILQKILDSFGATAGDVAIVHVVVKEGSVRAFVNDAWVAMFPDENSRPARHTAIDEGLASFVQIEAVAVVEGWTR